MVRRFKIKYRMLDDPAIIRTIYKFAIEKTDLAATISEYYGNKAELLSIELDDEED